MARGRSFAQQMEVAESYAALSPGAQRIVKLLSEMPEKLADGRARREVREFLSAARERGIDHVGVERAIAVLAAYEGEIGGEQGERVVLVG